MSASDSELLQQCRAGDQAAWRELVSRHTRRVFNVAYRFVGRVDEAEDVTQDVFIKVYQGLDRYRDTEGAFTTWLTTVTRNQVIDHYRRRREERQRRADNPEILEYMPSAEDGPLHGLEREERIEFVRRGLRALPAELREPLILCDLQGMPYEEIARTLGMPLGTVKSRINRGRLELAKRLVDRHHEYARPS